MNATPPPTPIGPVMSGPLPEAIWVASVFRAASKVTTSNLSLMFGWLALNSSTTLFSTGELLRVFAGAEAAVPADLDDAGGRR